MKNAPNDAAIKINVNRLARNRKATKPAQPWPLHVMRATGNARSSGHIISSA